MLIADLGASAGRAACDRDGLTWSRSCARQGAAKTIVKRGRAKRRMIVLAVGAARSAA
jgi:hypothetical protein